jgi:hypothetical protein
MTRPLIILLCLCLLVSSAGADGRLLITIRAGGSAEDLAIHITGPQSRIVTILPDGTADLKLPSGRYAASLMNGNAGDLEQIVLQIADNETTRISFLGHAVAKVTRRNCLCPVCPPEPEPEPNCTAIHHPEINHTVIIPTHTEHVYKTWSEYGWIYNEWQDGVCTSNIPEPWSEPDEIGEVWCIVREVSESAMLVVDGPAWDEMVCEVA